MRPEQIAANRLVLTIDLERIDPRPPDAVIRRGPHNPYTVNRELAGITAEMRPGGLVRLRVRDYRVAVGDWVRHDLHYEIEADNAAGLTEWDNYIQEEKTRDQQPRPVDRRDEVWPIPA